MKKLGNWRCFLITQINPNRILKPKQSLKRFKREESKGTKVFETQKIRINVALAEAQLAGTTNILTNAPDSNGAKDYENAS